MSSDPQNNAGGSLQEDQRWDGRGKTSFTRGHKIVFLGLPWYDHYGLARSRIPSICCFTRDIVGSSRKWRESPPPLTTPFPKMASVCPTTHQSSMASMFSHSVSYKGSSVNGLLQIRTESTSLRTMKIWHLRSRGRTSLRIPSDEGLKVKQWCISSKRRSDPFVHTFDIIVVSPYSRVLSPLGAVTAKDSCFPDLYLFQRT